MPNAIRHDDLENFLNALVRQAYKSIADEAARDHFLEQIADELLVFEAPDSDENTPQEAFWNAIDNTRELIESGEEI